MRRFGLSLKGDPTRHNDKLSLTMVLTVIFQLMSALRRKMIANASDNDE